MRSVEPANSYLASWVDQTLFIIIRDSLPSLNKGFRRELTDLCGMCEESPRTARARVRRTQFHQNMPPTNDFYYATAVRRGFHFIRLNKKKISFEEMK